MEKVGNDNNAAYWYYYNSACFKMCELAGELWELKSTGLKASKLDTLALSQNFNLRGNLFSKNCTKIGIMGVA